MGWWILTIAVAALIVLAWVLLARSTDLAHRGRRHQHDPDRARALREAQREVNKGHRW